MYRVFLADDEPWILISLKNLIDWGECGYLICGEAQTELRPGNGSCTRSRI